MNTDKITTILGVIMAALAAGQQAIQAANGGQVNWVVVGVAVVGAVFAYFTNKQKKA